MRACHMLCKSRISAWWAHEAFGTVAMWSQSSESYNENFFVAASSILLEIGSIPLKYNQEKTDEAKPKLMFSATGLESTDQAAAVVNEKAS